MDRIETFLKKFSEILRNEHRELISKYYTFLLKYWDVPTITSTFGTHFETCPWSNDSTASGPDTCSCYYFDSYSKKLNEIVDWYESILQK